MEIDPFADYADRAIYSDLVSVPHLVQDADGAVSVHGGQKVWPKADKDLVTEADLDRLATTLATVKPAPKKHWWQFWKRSPKPAPAAVTSAQ